MGDAIAREAKKKRPNPNRDRTAVCDLIPVRYLLPSDWINGVGQMKSLILGPELEFLGAGEGIPDLALRARRFVWSLVLVTS